MERISILPYCKNYKKGDKLWSPALGVCRFVEIEPQIDGGVCWAERIIAAANGTNYSFDQWGALVPGGPCMIYPSKECQYWAKKKEPNKHKNTKTNEQEFRKKVVELAWDMFMINNENVSLLQDFEKAEQFYNVAETYIKTGKARFTIKNED